MTTLLLLLLFLLLPMRCADVCAVANAVRWFGCFRACFAGTFRQDLKRAVHASMGKCASCFALLLIESSPRSAEPAAPHFPPLNPPSGDLRLFWLLKKNCCCFVQ